MKVLGKYKNGNILVTILSDGTKIRISEDDAFIPSFAENMDIKITNYCDIGCEYCHEGSCIKGKHADILSEKFIDTLHPYQEVALGGGDVTSHPDLIPFLKKLKALNIITNITINQIHFERKQFLIEYLIKENLIYGLGVSLVNPTDKFIHLMQKYPNAIVHVINGVVRPDQIQLLKNKNLKILILGYKNLRRGEMWLENNNAVITANQNWLKQNLSTCLSEFNVMSFDNLAIEQLNVKALLTDSEWRRFYAGDDGSHTYYIDMVERKFAVSSTALEQDRYDLLDSVDDMFNYIKNI